MTAGALSRDRARAAAAGAPLALALAAGIALPRSVRGGPLDLVNHQPVVYPNGGASLTLNLDQGPLGTRTNAQAAAMVQSAIALWNGVATSTMRLVVGSPLAADYTAANYATSSRTFPTVSTRHLRYGRLDHRRDFRRRCEESASSDSPDRPTTTSGPHGREIRRRPGGAQRLHSTSPTRRGRSSSRTRSAISSASIIRSSTARRVSRRATTC